MPTFIERVTGDIADAMRRRDAVSLAPLRMLKAALMNREVEKGRGLDESESLQVVGSLVKQRRDAIEQFAAGGRQDLVDRERAEITLLERYLPPAADDQAIAAAVEAAVLEADAKGPKDMGRVMKATLARLNGLTVDGRIVSEFVRNRLGR